MPRTRTLIVTLALLVAASPAGAQDAFKQDSLAYARKVAAWLYSGQADSLFANHSVDVRSRLRNSQALQDPIDELKTRAGAEEEVLAERFVKRKGRTQYWRTARFSRFQEPLLLRFAFNKQGEIVGIGFAPESQAPLVDAR
jgi:hypothetical protein